MIVRTTVKSIQDIMRQDVGVDGDAQRISQLTWMFFLKIIDDQDQELELTRDGYQSPIPDRFQWRNWAADPEGVTGQAMLDFVNGALFPALKGLKLTGQPGDRRRVVRDVFEDAYNYMKSGQLLRQVVNKINGIDFNNLDERRHFGEFYEQLLNDLQSAGNAGEFYTPRAVTAFMVDRIDPHPGETLFDPACGTGGFLTCAINHMEKAYVRTPQQRERMQGALRAVEKKQLPHMLCVTNMLLHGVEDPSFVRHDNTLARPLISWGQDERVEVVVTNPPFGGKEEDGIENNFPTFRTKETADLFLALIVRLLKHGGRAAVVLPDGTLFGEGMKTRLKEHLLEECYLHTIVRLPNSVFKPYASIGTNLLFFEKGTPTKDIWFFEHRVPEGQKAYSMTKPIRLEHFQGCIDWWGGKERKGREETPQAWKVSAEEVKARGYNLDFKNPHSVADTHGDPEALLADLASKEAETVGYREELKAILARGAGPMTAVRLLAHYERVTDAPDAIARLRRFILELAVRGKLVPQHEGDEPASELRKKIAKEKVRLGFKGQPVPVRADEAPFELPIGWSWTRIGEICSKTGSGSTPRGGKEVYKASGVPFLRSQNVHDDGLRLNDVAYIDVATHERMSGTRVAPGDLLLNITGGSMGRCCLVPSDLKDANISQHVAIIRVALHGMEAFLHRLVLSPYFQAFVFDEQTGAGRGGLPKNRMDLIAVALPPLAEQSRIVAKVDELMCVCDRLEASLAATAATRGRLLDALLAEALSPAKGRALEAAE